MELSIGILILVILAAIVAGSVFGVVWIAVSTVKFAFRLLTLPFRRRTPTLLEADGGQVQRWVHDDAAHATRDECHRVDARDGNHRCNVSRDLDVELAVGPVACSSGEARGRVEEPVVLR